RVVGLQLRRGRGAVGVVGHHRLLGHHDHRIDALLGGPRTGVEGAEVDLPERAVELHVAYEVGHGGVGVVAAAEVTADGVHDGHAVRAAVGVDHDQGALGVALAGQDEGPGGVVGIR